MIDTEYLTQILFKSTRQEDPVVFFRRVQRKIWSLLPYFFPEIDTGGKGILDALTFDVFSQQRSFQASLNRVDNISGRNLETANICSHAITISRAGESAHVRGQSDNTYKTEICIEMAKRSEGKSCSVRFSYMTRIIYQPFAGFYPLSNKRYETPDFISELLVLSDCEPMFMPRLDCIERGSFPKFKYPVLHKVIHVNDTKVADDFLERLNDRARPICFLVYMGSSERMRDEAEHVLPIVYSKAWVYIIERPSLIEGKIESIIHGIDVKEDFQKKNCRLFFTFGSYSPENFANPSYPITFFHRSRYRELVFNGLLRFFDIDEPGWRRTQRDIHMLQLDLEASRKMALKDTEVSDSRDALAKKDEIIRLVLDLRKKEKESIEEERAALAEDRKLFEDDNKRLENENTELSAAKSALEGQVSALTQKLLAWQESGSQSVFRMDIENFYPNEVYDHLVEMLKMLDGNIPAVQLRRRQIYEALVQANPSSGEMQKRKDAIADVLRNKNGLTQADIRLFEGLGFTYSKDGPHHKLTMGSFFMTVPCTGGDSGRGWKNSIRDFNRNFFVPTKGEPS